MSRLPDDEWLHLAKRVAVNSQQRKVHLREHTPALIVGNLPDRWWAYCQRCKRGAIVQKEHSMVVTREPPQSRELTLPHDLRGVGQLEGYELSVLATFLAAKNMDFLYLPHDITWSAQRHRMVVRTPEGYMGRDTSGRSPQKWLSYSGQHYATVRVGDSRVVLTEDLFSAHKVAFAMPEVSVYCTLGTAMHRSLVLEVATRHGAACRIMSFYDGDSAGYAGAANNTKLVNPLGLVVRGKSPKEGCAPDGLDPKDMELDSILNAIVRWF